MNNPNEKYTATIPVEVSITTLWDIMTTMRETCYEWFGFKHVIRAGEKTNHPLDVTSFTALEIDCDGDCQVMSEYVVTPRMVFDGMVKMTCGNIVNKPNTNTILRCLAEDDASYIDSDAADCILQYVCFGEIRYG